MFLSSDSDVIAMKIHLNELRSKFDLAMREGESFARMKEIHQQIKELESCIQVLEWNGISTTPSPRSKEEPASRSVNEKKYRHVEEPPPLL